jgi:hypothetical protein
VTYGVHPTVKGVEPAGRDAVLDRRDGHARREELRPPDHPVLPLGEGAEHLVDGKRDGFGSYSDHKASRLVHGADLRATNATEHPPSMPT